MKRAFDTNPEHTTTPAARRKEAGARLKRNRVILNLVGVLAILCAIGVSAAAAATDWYVDSTMGNDANTCMAPGSGACQTIQAAINKASNNDTIHVAAGSYSEPAPGPLTVNKTLT